ncbi:MAG: hypothetical protein J1F33_03090 [Clostridiales bacterium]|nr:hypothetical protein [Clostridiales bacterium]
MKKFSRYILHKTYQISPVTIAFIYGGIISAAINLLTGLGTYVGSTKWMALSASIILIIDSILLFLLQNAASKLQELYKPWSEFVTIQNKNSNSPDQQKSTDWIAFLEACNEKESDNNCNIILDNNVSKKPELPKYSIIKLILYPILSLIFFVIGIGLMIASFF